MPKKMSERNLFDKHSSSPKTNPLKDVIYVTKKVDHVQPNNRNINLDNKPEQKEGRKKLSEPKIFTSTKVTTEQKIFLPPICITDVRNYT